MKIPHQYNSLMLYMIVPDAYRFIKFMKNVFRAAEQIIVPRSEGVIMHGEPRIGDAVIMFADTTEQFASGPRVFLFIWQMWMKPIKKH